jgi:hypothetical protein
MGSGSKWGQVYFLFILGLRRVAHAAKWQKGRELGGDVLVVSSPYLAVERSSWANRIDSTAVASNESQDCPSYLDRL